MPATQIPRRTIPHSSAVALLRSYAERDPDALGLRLRAGDGWKSFTWSEYYDLARKAAAALQDRRVEQSAHVLIIDSDPLRSVPALFGLWLLGAVPIFAAIPESPGSNQQDRAEFLQSLAKRFHAKHVLLDPSLMTLEAELPELECVSTETLLEYPAGALTEGRIDSSSTGIIQLTSGTTGRPRGIVIQHGKLVAHMEGIVNALAVGDDASAISWLPLHHDMGLYGGLLFPLCRKLPTALMSPMAFRRRPLIWLEALDELKATCTAGPPSAYAVLLRMVQRAIDAGLRFDHWDCAVIGAEHIPPQLLRSFIRSFAPIGLRDNVFFPVYGLAECTVAVTFSEQGAGLHIDAVDNTSAPRSQSVPSGETGGGVAEYVGTGQPIGGTELRIVDGDGLDLRDSEIGEIWIRTTTGMAHYFDDKEATDAAFEDGWLKTGDVGYTIEGELFVVGRKKDLIIKGGRNFSPAAIEAAVETVDGVRAGASAAVGLYSETSMTETAYIVVECATITRNAVDLAPLIRVQLQRLGLPCDRVLLVSPRTLPRTTSGKIKRNALADMIRLGQLDTC